MVQSEAAKRNALHELGYKIFLDRYAQKDMTRSTLKVGDTVIVVVDSATGQREIGKVTAMNLPQVTIELLDGDVVTRDLEHVDKPLETDPADMMARVARGIASVEATPEQQEKWAERFRWLMDDWKFVPAGRILAAAGTDQELTFYNCFVIPSPRDSRHGIIETLRQMTEIMSRGGGVGINISTLRPRHAYVKGVNGRSSGAISWGALYSFVTGLIEQGGSRRGALMVILNDWHPDIFDFINSKRKMGQITNANISVGVSDKLMEAIKADGDWDLMFPDTTYPDYTLTWDGDLDKWIAAGRRVVKHRTVKAREVWNAIIESAWASAEPGVWFNERANKMSNSFYFNPLICTNPCHSGDNLIHTRKGLIPIRELVGKEFEVISDLRTIDGVGVHYERAIAYRTGHEQLYEVKLKTGHTIELTGNHKVFTRRGKVQVQDLKVRQDAVLLQSAPHLDALLTLDENYLKQGRIVGWNAGDGWLSEFPSEHQGTGVNVGFIFNQEETYARDYVLEYVNQTTTTSRPVTARLNQGCWEIQTSNANAVQLFKTFGLSPKSRKRVTSEIASAPLAFRIGFLQGLFSSDGHIGGYKHSKTGNILLVTVNKGLATGVQILLSDLGIKTYLRTRQAKGIRYVTKDGEIKLSKASLAYTVRIAGQDGIRRFARLVGFPMSTEKQTKLDNHLSEMEKIRPSLPEYWSEVVSITPTKVEDVYNLTTEISHSLIANGVVVSNCGEQSIGAWSVCNLGAINLAKFYNESTNDVAWDELADAAAYGAHFLDNVIDATPYFFEENRERQLGERRVGLGIMGLAELMIQLGIRYGSDEGVAFTEKLFKFLTEHSYLESARVAAEKGAFTEYDKRFLDSGFMQRVKAELPHVYDSIEKQGMRNVTVLTVAPTGTTGTMVNTSTGIEPFFSWVYYRKSRLGLHEEQVPLVKEWYAQNPDAEHLPEYFITAMDLAPEEHVRMQAAAQKWVDSSISKTANLPNSYTVEQVSDLYKYMYELGCKGGTIYRDGSRNEQVLMLKGDERAEKEMENKSKSREPEKVEQTATPHRVYPRPEKLSGATVKCTTPFGTAYVTMNSDENGYPFEVFITAPGKAGSDLQADAEGLGRMVSLALRTTAPQNRLDMLRLVIEQLKDIGGTSRVGFGPSRVNSLPDALANVLQNYYLSEDAPQQMALPLNGAPKVEAAPTPIAEKPKNGNGKKPSYDICPSCGNAALVHAEGCSTCTACGYSKC
jgi:ribonucleoside-diphosphate reductase alpha chain